MKKSSEPYPKTPPITDALLAYLRYLYPEEAPNENETFEALRYRAGQVCVVRHLAAVKELQDSGNYLE